MFAAAGTLRMDCYKTGDGFQSVLRTAALFPNRPDPPNDREEERAATGFVQKDGSAPLAYASLPPRPARRAPTARNPAGYT